MERITRLGFAMILAAVASVPGSSEAACNIPQCYSEADCSQYVCPQGQSAIPRCNGIYCYSYCICKTLG